jgi:hypothetical protein
MDGGTAVPAEHQIGIDFELCQALLADDAGAADRFAQTEAAVKKNNVTASRGQPLCHPAAGWAGSDNYYFGIIFHRAVPRRWDYSTLITGRAANPYC